MSEQHENVAHAVNLLDQAVNRLVGPRSDYIEGRYVTRPSRYTELSEARRIHAESASHRSGSMAPVWLEAVDFIRDVDKTVRGWAEGDSTPGRLNSLTEAHWRPQDLDMIADYHRAILTWAARADALLDPQRQMELAAACPSCGVSIVYKRDQLGESVKTPALMISTKGCSCLSCRETWEPDKFLWLARVLSCEPMQGVRENVL